MDDKEILAQLENSIRARVPEFEVRYKNESTFMKTLGFLLRPVNPQFMTRFTTTIGTTVYFPSRADVDDAPRRFWKVLAHEYVHILDHKEHGLWFSASYLLPHLLAVLALGAFFSPWFLLALTALAPLPSPWRTRWEMRGYTMSMAVNYWKYGNVTNDTIYWVGKNFWGWNYYKMSWRKLKIRDRLYAEVDRIKSSEVLKDSPAFHEVKDIIDRAKEKVALA